MTTRLLSALAVATLVAACAAHDTGEDSSRAEPASPSNAPSAAAGKLRAHIVLAGGPDAGTYDLTPPGAECIDYAAAGGDGLGVAYYGDPQASKGSVVEIDFGTTKLAPARAGTSDFGFTVGVSTGEVVAHRHVVKPATQQGTGTATVSGTAPRYTVTISGHDTDGVGVEATLECLR